MTSNTGQLFVLAIPRFSPGDLAWIQDVRARLDPALKLVPPHFTLVFPGHPLGVDELVSHVREQAGSHDRFRTGLTEVEILDHGRGGAIVISLIPERGFAEILELHDRLYTGILKSSLREDLPYKPHVTIGRFDNREAADQAANSLSGIDIDIVGKVTELTVVKLLDGELSTIEVIPLGGGGENG